MLRHEVLQQAIAQIDGADVEGARMTLERELNLSTGMDLHILVDLILEHVIDREQLGRDMVEVAVRYGVDVDDARAAVDPASV